MHILNAPAYNFQKIHLPSALKTCMHILKAALNNLPKTMQNMGFGRGGSIYIYNYNMYIYMYIALILSLSLFLSLSRNAGIFFNIAIYFPIYLGRPCFLGPLPIRQTICQAGGATADGGHHQRHHCFE